MEQGFCPHNWQEHQLVKIQLNKYEKVIISEIKSNLRISRKDLAKMSEFSNQPIAGGKLLLAFSYYCWKILSMLKNHTSNGMGSKA